MGLLIAIGILLYIFILFILTVWFNHYHTIRSQNFDQNQIAHLNPNKNKDSSIPPISSTKIPPT